MKQLQKMTRVYRVEDEEEALTLIEEFKNNQVVEGYIVTKTGYTLKTKKSKGEIVDSFVICSIEQTFNV